MRTSSASSPASSSPTTRRCVCQRNPKCLKLSNSTNCDACNVYRTLIVSPPHRNKTLRSTDTRRPDPFLGMQEATRPEGVSPIRSFRGTQCSFFPREDFMHSLRPSFSTTFCWGVFHSGLIELLRFIFLNRIKIHVFQLYPTLYQIYTITHFIIIIITIVIEHPSHQESQGS